MGKDMKKLIKLNSGAQPFADLCLKNKNDTLMSEVQILQFWQLRRSYISYIYRVPRSQKLL